MRQILLGRGNLSGCHAPFVAFTRDRPGSGVAGWTNRRAALVTHPLMCELRREKGGGDRLG
ncbi:hypothetical protein [Alloprevotella tannerae]|uniref:hypothetical protein n=1 Tax=Alloprevotella tannerae TaxID=76122 RepID=UPI0028EA7634|nr:hypothetical protein [Alloprevotella tannerae]